MPRANPPHRRAQRRIRAAIEAMERRILLSSIAVNTFVDQIDPPGSNTVSLRDAIALATARQGSDTINLIAGHYALTHGQLLISDISGELTIAAVGGTAVIDAGGKSRTLDVKYAFVPLGNGNYTVASPDVLLDGLTITGGMARGQPYFDRSGGGIFNDGSKLTLTDCTVSNSVAQEAGGGICNLGLLDVIRSTITGNIGGKPDNYFYKGTAGGLYNGGTASLTNCTIAENQGLGIGSENTITITNCTIPDAVQAGSGTIANSIIGVTEFGGTSLGHNVVAQSFNTNWLSSDIVGKTTTIDPRLSPLGNFGGRTQTMAPMAGSPALGAGALALLPKGVTTDQRGSPRVWQGKVDVGAVQTQPPSRIEIFAPAAQSFIGGTLASVDLGSFTGPAGAGPFVARVDWNDGSAATFFDVATSGPLHFQHEFTHGGALTCEVAITDRLGDLSNLIRFDVTILPAAPTTIVVNTAKDQSDPAGSATVSLRDAVRMADASFGSVSIEFDPAMFAQRRTLYLFRGPLELSTNTFAPITLDAPGPGLAVSGNGLGSILIIDPDVNASFTGFTFTDGGEIHKPAIINKGVASLNYCIITKNGSSDAPGGAIENDGNLSIADSKIFYNVAFYSYGGGIYSDGTLTVTRSIISNNSSTGAGGGGICSTGSLTLVDCTLSDNTCVGQSSKTTSLPPGGGAIFAGGVSTISGCTISANTSYRYVNTYNSDFTGGGYGGGIDNAGQLTLTNSTISGNSADSFGGGLANSGSAHITSCTITDNTGDGGGIQNNSGSVLTLANSIVATNHSIAAGINNIDVAGAIKSLGHNLVGKSDGSSGWIKSDFKGSAVHPIDPHLSPLADFGGPTKTQIPITGSPAIGAGAAALLPSGTTTDQRGFKRITNGLVDIGAVQLQRSALLAVRPPAPQTVVAGTLASISLGSFGAGKNKGPFYVTVIWGDGSSETDFTVASAGSLGRRAHTFTNVGALNGEIFVRDAAGNISQDGRFSIIAATHATVALVVNTSSDQTDPAGSKTMSLPDAARIADQSFGPVSITFDPKVFSTEQFIVLSDGLTFSHNVFGIITITAPAAALSVGGSNNSAIQIAKGVTLSLAGVAIVGAGSSGVVNQGSALLSNCTISGNLAVNGGGINNLGVMTLTDCKIAHNSIQPPENVTTVGDGGGILNSGQLTIVGCWITNNTGCIPNDSGNAGAIYNTGDLTITGSTISGTFGAGIVSHGRVAISDSTISKNIGGGIFSTGELTLNDCALSYNTNTNYGANALVADNATLTNCTISGNDGAIVDHGDEVLTNCTVANNGVGWFGDQPTDADIFVAAGDSVVLNNCTITGNFGSWEGGGLYLQPSDLPGYPAAKATIANTIIATNSVVNGPTVNDVAIFGTDPDVSGTVISLGHNLIGDAEGSSGWTFSDLLGTRAHPLDPLLSPLDRFGGKVRTMIPLTGSPALLTGSAALVPGGLSTDARGLPRVVNGSVDIGAVQTQAPPAINVTGPADRSAIAGVSTSIAIGSFTAPGNRGPFLVVIHWGDGSSDTSFWLPRAGSMGNQRHTFVSIGTLQASVEVTDHNGTLSNQASFNVTVPRPALKTIVVNTTKDQSDSTASGKTSLRDALTIAEHSFGDVLIKFDSTVFATPQTLGIENLHPGGLAGPTVEFGGNHFGTVTIVGPPAGVTITDFYPFIVDRGFSLALVGVTFTGGFPGILSNDGTLSVRNCTFTQSNRGAAISNYGSLIAINSTFSDNLLGSVYFQGNVSGIYNAGTALVSDCTIDDNNAALFNEKGGSFTIANSIVAGSTTGFESLVDVFGRFKSEGHNLIGNIGTSKGWIASDLTGNTAKPLDPKLSDLGDFGGPTQTQVPLAGSPVTDAGSVALIPKGITTDQRGKPRVVNDKVDIGAVEVQAGESH